MQEWILFQSPLVSPFPRLTGSTKTIFQTRLDNGASRLIKPSDYVILRLIINRSPLTGFLLERHKKLTEHTRGRILIDNHILLFTVVNLDDGCRKSHHPITIPAIQSPQFSWASYLRSETKCETKICHCPLNRPKAVPYSGFSMPGKNQLDQEKVAWSSLLKSITGAWLRSVYVLDRPCPMQIVTVLDQLHVILHVTSTSS